MLFNSFEFALFLPIVFVLYWYVLKTSIKAQNVFLLVASYVFYGWWDWRFLSLIIISSTIDFIAGKQIQKSTSNYKKKVFLWLSICTNLGFLGCFKYFNFFSESFANLIESVGFQTNTYSLNVILPVGISFYTFQTMSYTIDVYKGKMKASENVIAFFAYVSFFPQLVAGPIERAKNLLPQFRSKREFTYDKGADGVRLILWGLFKKVVIADNCALVVNQVFANYDSLSGLELVVGAVFFAIQIYGDFSGYSDIAIGTAKLLGFELMTNFKTPYFSRDIGEFWRRWHISLSTWFRDYVYIPLGGSKVSQSRVILNTFVIFIISGFWHGANWTFILWGVLNAFYFLPLVLSGKNRKNLDTVAQGKFLPSIKEFLQMASTFTLTCIAWVLFRSKNMNEAIGFFDSFFKNEFIASWKIEFSSGIFLVIIFWIVMEWISREKENISVFIGDIKKPFMRKVVYAAMVLLIALAGNFNDLEFIYFQF